MSDETHEPLPDRRRLTIAAICGSLGAICTGLGLPSLVYLLSAPKTQSKLQWVDLGALDGFAPGVPQMVTFSRTRIDGWVVDIAKERAWVVTGADGKPTVFSPRCPHLGCAYDWNGALRQFVCPCHGSRFASDGRRTAGPANRGLDRYEVKTAGRRLWLKLAARQEASRS
ncbi:MAG TPA: Rieske 2Fe-2S domain-containing protein [Bryobacteraceae bacterium]|nr:Rieske 2Fe-2S domain-containing protein [Bryobacteraceae bacterium]